MLKAELHTHTADDPADAIPHTTEQLIDRAAALGYHVLAITLHDRQLDIRPYRAYARERGITLIAGVERTVSGRHVLLLNFPAEAERVRSFAEIDALKRRCAGLVIAPHPFYPAPSCLGRQLDRHAHLFDAVEYNYFYTSRLNWPNEKACRWAVRHEKPIVANSDVHRLSQLGLTYSLIDAEPDPDEICRAVRAGRIDIRSEPISLTAAAAYLVSVSLGGLRGRARRSGWRALAYPGPDVAPARADWRIGPVS